MGKSQRLLNELSRINANDEMLRGFGFQVDKSEEKETLPTYTSACNYRKLFSATSPSGTLNIEAYRHWDNPDYFISHRDFTLIHDIRSEEDLYYKLKMHSDHFLDDFLDEHREYTIPEGGSLDNVSNYSTQDRLRVLCENIFQNPVARDADGDSLWELFTDHEECARVVIEIEFGKYKICFNDVSPEFYELSKSVEMDAYSIVREKEKKDRIYSNLRNVLSIELDGQLKLRE